MSFDLVSIDPGLNACGVAAWQGDTLLWARYVEARASSPVEGGSKLYLMMHALLDDSMRPGVHIGHVAIEIPQIYVRSRSKGDPNDLIQLATVVGAICHEWRSNTVYKPADWKGQVPKEVMCRRIQKHMTPSEIDRVILPSAKSLHHNVWDGIGIGLHHLGRL